MLKEKYGIKPDMDGVLFLIGVQELGTGKQEYTKEQKQDLMHIAVCTLLAQSGYYALGGYDEEACTDCRDPVRGHFGFCVRRLGQHLDRHRLRNGNGRLADRADAYRRRGPGLRQVHRRHRRHGCRHVGGRGFGHG